MRVLTNTNGSQNNNSLIIILNNVKITNPKMLNYEE